MEYLIIIEKSTNGYGAYAPDLPGIGVAGKTKKEVLKLIKDSIVLHLEDLKSRRLKIPKPQNEAVSVLV